MTPRLRVAVVLLLAAITLVAASAVSAETTTIIDFAQSGTITGGWIVAALPSGAKVDTAIGIISGTPRRLNLTLDLTALPEGSTGIALIPESGFTRGSGVLDNVGVIQSLSIVAGLEGMSGTVGVVLTLADDQPVAVEFPMEDNSHRGGEVGTKVWSNPAYITEVRNREIQSHPLYPPGRSRLTFAGFVIRPRPELSFGTLKIISLYVKEVSLKYDKRYLQNYKWLEEL
jgi:hypothetical protein